MKSYLTVIVICFSFVVTLTGCSNQPDKDIHDKLSFYGIDLRVLDKAPICPSSFFSNEKLDRSNLYHTSAEYLCVERGIFAAVLIPKEQNYLNAVYINFEKPFSYQEDYYIQLQFSSDSTKKIWQYLIDKYGEPHQRTSSSYWAFEAEGVEIVYQNIYWPQVTIYFPRTDRR